jgi:hypothetical protein
VPAIIDPIVLFTGVPFLAGAGGIGLAAIISLAHVRSIAAEIVNPPPSSLSRWNDASLRGDMRMRASLAASFERN